MRLKFTSHKLYPQFEVYEDNKMVIQIKIDTEMQAFRIKCQDTRRVFFIADEVVKKNRVTTLLNEYSQQLGSLTKSKSGIDAGEIEIEGISYTYELNDGLKEITLFERDNNKPVLNCRLEMGQLSFLDVDYVNYILFALVWFKFLTKEQPVRAQFAEA